ncbi:uncharacterized protein LOC141661860 isoform X2 [Apium graveolens]|uniref:uncharacterized protein LOC141661860 isoform X2 n=1 Tax=Apium graveolens TaxID=4045 RepID=UPI003D79A55B
MEPCPFNMLCRNKFVIQSKIVPSWTNRMKLFLPCLPRITRTCYGLYHLSRKYSIECLLPLLNNMEYREKYFYTFKRDFYSLEPEEQGCTTDQGGATDQVNIKRNVYDFTCQLI